MKVKKRESEGDLCMKYPCAEIGYHWEETSSFNVLLSVVQQTRDATATNYRLPYIEVIRSKPETLVLQRYDAQNSDAVQRLWTHVMKAAEWKIEIVSNGNHWPQWGFIWDLCWIQQFKNIHGSQKWSARFKDTIVCQHQNFACCAVSSTQFKLSRLRKKDTFLCCDGR